MSTRGMLLLYSRFEEYDWETSERTERVLPVARFYRHCDNYPDGAGLQIALALAEASQDEGLNNRNWAQRFLARYLAADADLEMEPPDGEHQWSHGDIEYVYRLTGPADYSGGKDAMDSIGAVEVEVFGIRGFDSVDRDYGDLGEHEQLYSGGWRGMFKWIRRHCERHNADGRCPLDGEYSRDSWLGAGCCKDTWNNARLLSNG